jgi:hypothetical protein
LGWEFIVLGANLIRFKAVGEFGKHIIADLREFGKPGGQLIGARHSLVGLGALKEGLSMISFGLLLIADGLGHDQLPPSLPQPPGLR